MRNLKAEDVSIDTIGHLIDAGMKKWDIPGISLTIINDGEMAYHTVRGYSNRETQRLVDAETVFEGASLSKPLFAYLVMTLVDNGRLDLDAPLHEYLEYPDISHDSRYRKITARMVLAHTTGLPNWRTDYKDQNLFIQFEPGTEFHYSGEGYQYLAKVVERILGTDYNGLESYFQEKIASPLHMKSTRFVQNEHNIESKADPYRNGQRLEKAEAVPEFGAAYGVHSEAVDFSKWVIALMDGGVVPKKGLDPLFEVQIEMSEDSPYRQDGITAWTLGLAKAEIMEHVIYGHGGNNPGFTSMFLLDREQKWGLVFFANADQVSDFGIELFMSLHGK